MYLRVHWCTQSALPCTFFLNAFEGHNPFDKASQGDLVLVKNETNENQNGVYKISRLNPFRMSSQYEMSKHSDVVVHVMYDDTMWRLEKGHLHAHIRFKCMSHMENTAEKSDSDYFSMIEKMSLDVSRNTQQIRDLTGILDSLSSQMASVVSNVNKSSQNNAQITSVGDGITALDAKFDALGQQLVSQEQVLASIPQLSDRLNSVEGFLSSLGGIASSMSQLGDCINKLQASVDSLTTRVGRVEMQGLDAQTTLKNMQGTDTSFNARITKLEGKLDTLLTTLLDKMPTIAAHVTLLDSITNPNGDPVGVSPDTQVPAVPVLLPSVLPDPSVQVAPNSPVVVPSNAVTLPDPLLVVTNSPVVSPDPQVPVDPNAPVTTQ